ncbi:hypothetical protein O3P69_002269 [Scylla paramamosain]|uniref:Uncharacterized protein n=1 Tax=Scylla paramamosain TaxID=85552 RepID=A0AAW0V881_SCYPA
MCCLTTGQGRGGWRGDRGSGSVCSVASATQGARATVNLCLAAGTRKVTRWTKTPHQDREVSPVVQKKTRYKFCPNDSWRKMLF